MCEISSAIPLAWIPPARLPLESKQYVVHYVLFWSRYQPLSATSPTLETSAMWCEPLWEVETKQRGHGSKGETALRPPPSDIYPLPSCPNQFRSPHLSASASLREKHRKSEVRGSGLRVGNCALLHCSFRLRGPRPDKMADKQRHRDEGKLEGANGDDRGSPITRRGGWPGVGRRPQRG